MSNLQRIFLILSASFSSTTVVVFISQSETWQFFSGLKLLKCVTMGNTFDFIQDSRPCDQESANGSPCLIE